MTPNRLHQHLHITVAALTRRRPQMVQALIESWGGIDLPANCTTRCLIVENDEQPHSHPLVTATPILPNGAEISYVLETETGIPFGRNRAAKEALAQGADLLVFVDDDETVAKDWLVKLIDGYRHSEAVLLGAPLRVAPPIAHMTPLQSAIYEGLIEKYREKEKRALEKATLNTTPGITVVTNNWLAETRLFHDENIWFDETMRFTGGTDTKFYETVKGKGFKTGWVHDAYAYESIPVQRLSFLYQYRRARDQANTNFHRHLMRKPRARYQILLRTPGKIIQLCLLALAIPFSQRHSLLKLARTSGSFFGKLGAIFGTRSNHYIKTSGH
jgi:Predicted glycosyltransferases